MSFVYYENIENKAVPVLASNGFCKNTGIPREHVLTWLQSGMFERMHPDDVGIVNRISMDFLNGKGPYNVVFRCRLSEAPAELRSKDSESKNYVLIYGLGKWQTMPDGTRLMVISYANLTNTQNGINDFLKEYGVFQKDRFYTDSLTDLPNINYLHEFGEEKVNRIKSDNGHPAAIYVDVDSMQSYNNQYGFDEGDKLLKLIAETLRNEFPKALVTRGADDHFIVVADEGDMEVLKQKLASCNERITQKAKGNTGGIRAGVCPIESNGTDNMIGKAIDHAKHALKRMNMNEHVRIFSQELDDAYWRSRYIVENIDRAIENGWIKVFYHGLYRVRTQKVAAFEALARWVDPSRGIINPGELIPALQKYHLLYKLDLCMFEQVCKEVKIRHDEGLQMVPVSINFSRQDFDHVDVVSKMNELYETTDAANYVDKDYFIIEITEQEVAGDPQRCQMQVRKIRESGYRLWLDDFGSGYSSFDMFSKFHFDLIKYDMELMRHLDDSNGANRIILKDLVHLAKALKLHTLVEGVETEEQLDFLKDIGCELAQGFYFHKPEPLDDILFRLHNGGTIKVCETPEERNELNREWFEQENNL